MPAIDERRISLKIAAFARSLREDHAFLLGHAHTLLALQSLDIIGVTDLDRVQSSLRAVFCSSPDDIAVFDALFEAYFLRPEGIENPLNQARHTRSGESSAPAERPKKSPSHVPTRADTGGDVAHGHGMPAAADPRDGVSSWQAMLARYSPHAGRSAPPSLTLSDKEAMLAAARSLIVNTHLGRSRRWRPQPRGPRLDMRHTLRASLRTGGDPTVLRRLGHPHRNPRFVVFIDGSRSMAGCVQPFIAFAAALCRRSRRVGVFMFSTGLRDVTRALRDRPSELLQLGDAWGGGTRIGANLTEFIRGRGRRLVSEDSLAIVFSDGIDVGEPERLKQAMREIHRKAAGVVWVNPHADQPNYKPEAGGMRAALPYIDLLVGPKDAAGYTRLARLVARAI